MACNVLFLAFTVTFTLVAGEGATRHCIGNDTRHGDDSCSVASSASMFQNRMSKHRATLVREKERRTPFAAGCFAIIDRHTCCLHTDGRSNFDGQDCIPSAGLRLRFTSGNTCEPSCIAEGTCFDKSAESNTGSCQEQHDDYYRPAYHISPLDNWMNDPQRPMQINGVWHLYYLYNSPDMLNEHTTQWYHVTSHDLVNWKDEGVAIPADKNSILTGSLFIDRNGALGEGNGPLVAITTTQDREGKQHQSLFVSGDNGYTFRPYSQKPLLENPGQTDWRDPSIVFDSEHGQWVFVLAEGDKIGFYVSPNLKDWTYASGFMRDDLGVMECPQFFQMDLDNDPEKRLWILGVSGTWVDKGSTQGFAYWVGGWTGTHFNPANDEFQWLDSGPDFFAAVIFGPEGWHDRPQSTLYPLGERYILAWMSNWHYGQNSFPRQRFAGVMSIVRKLRMVSKPQGGFGLYTKYYSDKHYLKVCHHAHYSIEQPAEVASQRSNAGYCETFFYDAQLDGSYAIYTKSPFTSRRHYLQVCGEQHAASVDSVRGWCEKFFLLAQSDGTYAIYTQRGSSKYFLSVCGDVTHPLVTSQTSVRGWCEKFYMQVPTLLQEPTQELVSQPHYPGLLADVSITVHPVYVQVPPHFSGDRKAFLLDIRVARDLARGDTGSEVRIRFNDDGRFSETVGYNFAAEHAFLVRDQDAPTMMPKAAHEMHPTIYKQIRTLEVAPTEGTLHMRVFVDRCTVEVFVQGKTLSSLIFPRRGAERIHFVTSGGQLTLRSLSYTHLSADFSRTHLS